MRKILRILFVTIFIVSTLLVLFRWEEGPEQRDKNSTLIHKKDRWTDRGWVKAYGSINGNYYSGEERPVFTEAEIEQHTEKYLSTPAFRIRKPLLKWSNETRKL